MLTMREQLDQMGYTDLRNVAGMRCGLIQMVFTWGLAVDIGVSGYERRYCYERHADAFDALAAWDGKGHPSGPWIKCKGAGIDLLNPELTA